MGTKNKTDDRIVGSSTTSRTPIARQAFNSPFDPGFHFEEQVRCFRDMLENVQFIAVSIDMKGRVTFCNNYLLELTGWKRSEVIGEDWFERFISEESIDHLRELFLGDHSLEHLPCHYENDILTRDGRSFSIHFNNGILRNGAGAPIGLMSFGEDVTERKRTEDALEAEREKLRLLYENNPDAIVVMDPDLKIIYANKRVEDVTSLPIDAIKGKRCFEAIIGRKTVCKGCQVHEVLEHREPRERVKHEKTSGGKENWLQQLLYPIVDKNGNVESIVEIARDITADKKILEALDKSEERYRTLAEAALDQIYIIGDDNHVQYVNNYAARMFNKTPDEIIGTRHADLFPPDVAQEQRRMLNKVIRTGEPVYVENPTPFVDDEIWLGTRLVPLRNADGRVSSVLGISRDITERIRAEEALKESERKFRLVVEQSRDGIFIGTLDGRVVLYNNAMKEISGYAMEEVNEAGWFDLVYADLKQRVEAIVLVVRAFREELSYFEHQITRKDGKRAWISVSIRPITIEGRKYLLGMTTDITKRKLAENDLKRAYETEHRIAATLQESLIRAVPAVPGLDIGILYRSAFDAEMIGGDFYDIFELDNDLVAVLIGDVAGRGIKAAGLTETIRSSIRTLAYIDPSPAFALNQTNQSLLRQLPPSQTATAAFLLLDMRNGDVRFASAGHPRLIVRRQDHCEVLDGPKALPLGMFASGFEETYLSLEEGQGLLLCTDGLIEALGGAVPLAEDRIAKILGRLASETAQDEVEDLLMATSEYAEGIFKDDITIVSIKFSKRRGKGDQEAS